MLTEGDLFSQLEVNGQTSTKIGQCNVVFEYPLELLFQNGMRCQNMNGTMLSQIVCVMFLTHYCLTKVDFHVHKVFAIFQGQQKRKTEQKLKNWKRISKEMKKRRKKKRKR